MQNKQTENKKHKEQTNETVLQPDPETLHTTDPQDNMEGPISSLMHETGEKFEGDKTPEQAKKEKEEKM